MSRLKELKEAHADAEMRRQWAFDHQAEIYAERDLLVAVLARLWPSHVMQHSHHKLPKPAVCIHSPAGKLTWSIPPNMLDFYRGLCEQGSNDFDGCKTAEKRIRLENYARKTRCAFPPDATPLRNTT